MIPVIEKTKVSYDILCERGREVVREKDNKCYELGALACQVEKHYGENMLGDYAKQVNQGLRSVQGYRRVWWFISQNEPVFALWTEQQQLPTPVLSYSHFRVAARETVNDVHAELLNQCADNQWTCDEFELHLPGKSGMVREKVCEFEAERGYYDDYEDTCLFSVPEGLINKIQPGQTYTIVIYSERPLK